MTRDLLIAARETVIADLLCHPELTDDDIALLERRVETVGDPLFQIVEDAARDRISDAVCAGVEAMEARAETFA